MNTRKNLNEHQLRHLRELRNRHHEALGRSIYIDEVILYNKGDCKIKLACRKCDKTKVVWTSYIYKGTWSVCEHDLD